MPSSALKGILGDREFNLAGLSKSVHMSFTEEYRNSIDKQDQYIKFYFDQQINVINENNIGL